MTHHSRLLASVPAALLLASLFASLPARGGTKPASPAARPGAPAASTAVKPAPTPKKPTAPAPPPVDLVPKGWDRSIYNLNGRVVTAVNDVTFEAPTAYQEGFKFWAGRMKGGQRTELIELLTTTRERAEDGSLPFRRQVSRLQVDIMEQGQLKTPAGGLTDMVTTLVWEGHLDPEGNVKEISRTGGPEKSDDVDQLSFDLLDRIFPHLGERREMKPGDSFTDTISLPLPQRLAVKGLDEMKVVVARALTLREVRGSEVIFHLKISYEADPATPPTAPRTTCTISGGGAGEATFDMDDGLFVHAQFESRMLIELEAPLRHLPDQPEGYDPGTGKSRIDLTLNVSGTQILTRLFEEPEGEPADGGKAVEEPPAPGF